ncbi:Ff.00g069030.m01.CDS01 [Fusarium sp. VM40]|nr:Ff.00g069030.m01.CDS01 [Fusarium sp. VM40]
MDDEDPLAGFAVADVSSDEGEGVEAAKSRRTGQSEEAWQAIRKEYSAKVENGDIYKKIKLPLGPGASKMDIQEAIHAVEEHYFFRRYNEAEHLASDILVASDGLDPDSRQLLETYQAKCQKKNQHA